MPKGIIIHSVGGKYYKDGIKTKVRYPSQMGGYINYTYCSISAAKASLKELSRWARKRATITPMR
ncbi:MAG: hypothetical protein PHW62_00710 [Candidatus Ratteibacteria bacterium]|nr:hypothetical protein [Candidatus Ratteibacteria bacterium]